MPLVSISDAQRAPIPNANFAATVYHGLPLNLHQPTLNPRGGYLAFLGRISPEKRVDRAIEVARTLGIPLKIAAKVDRADEVYFRDADRAVAQRAGRANSSAKSTSSRRPNSSAKRLALMFLIDWPEPFGLSMIEAMACGTPVLAFRHGSVEEVVEDGLTGRIIDNVEEATSPCRTSWRWIAVRYADASKSGSRPRAWQRITCGCTSRCSRARM